ncbi:uncharacterized protein LOC129586898 [Paramacrobiotus metropolitanus]|uniref:uncharacterized protein LOC129586898 n=1 Tax=Paramacrobiotus metropolitanus TaxID=2943436 RepID=UPI00244573F3|nr:uncharacterized protein LOC129586898 [Paramacrobiotus metropolitanus]
MKEEQTVQKGEMHRELAEQRDAASGDGNGFSVSRSSSAYCFGIANVERTVQTMKRRIGDTRDKLSPIAEPKALRCAVVTCDKSLDETQQNQAWIKCTRCLHSFHLQCASVSTIALGTRRGAVSNTWMCRYCAKQARPSKKPRK